MLEKIQVVFNTEKSPGALKRNISVEIVVPYI